MDPTAPSGFATVKGLPVLGSLLPLSRDALGLFTTLLRERGDRVQLRVPGRSVLLLCHPHDIEQVLVRDREVYGRSAEIRKLRPIFGQGLLASEGDLWRRQRSLIQPSFQHAALARYSSIMIQRMHTQVQTWRAGEALEIHAEMMKYTRETICSVLFGDAFTAAHSGLGEAVSTVFGDCAAKCSTFRSGSVCLRGEAGDGTVPWIGSTARSATPSKNGALRAMLPV